MRCTRKGLISWLTNKPSMSVGPGLPAHLGALVVATVLLGACSKKPSSPPTPLTTPVQGATAPTTSGTVDQSVPEASAVLPRAAVAAKVDPAAGRSNSSMSREQESSSMPIPGQNNDHSAALTPGKRASGP